MDMASITRRDTSFQERAAGWFASGDRSVVVRTFRRRQSIYCEGDRAEHVACVASGSVQLSTITHGHACPVELRFAGELLGELSACGMNVRHESAQALERTTLQVAPVAAFADFVQREGLMGAMAGHFADALLFQQRKIAHLLLEQCERRLALTLLELSERRGGAPLVPLHLTQAELGRLIGTTRSRVGHFLKHFRELGLLGHFDANGVEVDRERLADYCR